MEEGTSNSFNCFFSHAKFTALLCVALQHNQNQIQIKINSSCLVVCMWTMLKKCCLADSCGGMFIILVMNQAAFLPSQQIDLELEDIYQPASTQPPASRRFPVYLKTQHTPVSRFVSTNFPAAPPPAPPQPILPRVAEAGQSY